MEMVAGPGVIAADLFLRTLRFCQYYRARDGDVCAVSDRYSGRRYAGSPRGAVVGLLFQSRRVTDALWNNTGADLLRRWLHYTANVVDTRADNVCRNDPHLECSRLRVVESTSTLVNQWLDIQEHP